MGNSRHCWLSVGEIKERIDKIDDANKTLSTTVSEGDPRYSSFSAEIPVGDTRCEAVWTATYELVGHMGPPWAHQADDRSRVQNSWASRSVKEDYVAHWGWSGCVARCNMGCVQARWRIATKYVPEFFASSRFLKGHGEAGSIRAVKIGPSTKIFPCRLFTSSLLAH
jgi:hypothetical protein